MSLTIQLDDATAEVVQELAATQHRSADEVVREALSAYVQTGLRVLPKTVGKDDSKFSEHIDRELNRLARLLPNWDAEGAQPIAPEIIAAARRFADQLPKHLAPVPAVVPMSKGNLQFEWHDGPRSLELEFETPNTIHYLKWHPEEGLEEEDVFPTTDLAKAELLLRWFHGSLTTV